MIYNEILEAYKNYEDGTYVFTTGSEVNFDKGYQVSFMDNNIDYSKIDLEFFVNKGIMPFIEHVYNLEDKNVYAGVWRGHAELSFHFKNIVLAMDFGRAFNQIAIWDWENGKEIFLK